MKFEEATPRAVLVVQTIEHLCDKIVIAGSLRRQKPDVNDIDIVLIPQTPWYWPATIANLLRDQLGMKIIQAGPELITLGFSEVDLPVDLYRARPETWGVLLLIRTGSIDHNIKLCSKAREMGLMLSAAKGVIKEGKVIASRTEQEIFKALEMEYVPPEKR